MRAATGKHHTGAAFLSAISATDARVGAFGGMSGHPGGSAYLFEA
jgi:hypothetical protein